MDKKIEGAIRSFGLNPKPSSELPLFPGDLISCAYLFPGVPYSIPIIGCIAVHTNNFLSVSAFSADFERDPSAQEETQICDYNSRAGITRAIRVNNQTSGVLTTLFQGNKEATALIDQALSLVGQVFTEFIELARSLSLAREEVKDWVARVQLKVGQVDGTEMFCRPLVLEDGEERYEGQVKLKQKSGGFQVSMLLYLPPDLLRRVSIYKDEITTTKSKDLSLKLKLSVVPSESVNGSLSVLQTKALALIKEARLDDSSTRSSDLELSPRQTPLSFASLRSGSLTSTYEFQITKTDLDAFLQIQPENLHPYFISNVSPNLYTKNESIKFTGRRWFQVPKSVEKPEKGVLKWLIEMHSRGIEFQCFPHNYLYYVKGEGFRLRPVIVYGSEDNPFKLKSGPALTEPEEFQESCAKLLSQYVVQQISPCNLSLDKSAKLLSLLPVTDLIPYTAFKTQKLESCQVLGKGGFGTIYLNEYRKEGDLEGISVALKVVRIEKRNKQSTTDALVEEYRIMSTVRCDNIIKVLGYTLYQESTVLLVLEYCQNDSLQKYLSNNDVSLSGKVKMLLGVANGIHFLHSKRIAHIDIKPHNILLNEDLVPKITDFGLSKKINEEEKLKKTGYTLLYSAPEQINGTEVDVSADIWAFGMLIYFVLFKKTPFEYLKIEGENLGNYAGKKRMIEDINTNMRKPLVPDTVSNGTGVFEFEQKHPRLIHLMRSCWVLEPKLRPPIHKILRTLRKLCDRDEVTNIA